MVGVRGKMVPLLGGRVVGVVRGDTRGVLGRVDSGLGTSSSLAWVTEGRKQKNNSI